MKKTMLLAGLVVVLVAGCDNKPAIPPMPSHPPLVKSMFER